LLYASENQEWFPLRLMANGAYHAPWLPNDMYSNFTVYMQMSTNTLTCPNQVLGTPDWYSVGEGGFRLGFYFLWGLPTSDDDRPRNVNYFPQPGPWDSPQKSTDSTPYTELMDDIIQRGTGTLGTVVNSTEAPHCPTGFIDSGNNNEVEPPVIGSQGGNVGSVDGSVEWRIQSVMLPRLVRWDDVNTPDFTFAGYW
jgi:hypothetical protein